MVNARRFFWIVAFFFAAVVLPGRADEPYQHMAGPFADPMEFDPDFQIFKPFDSFEYGAPREPRVGWFATYDRLWISMSRPETGGTFGMAGQLSAELGAFGQPRPVEMDIGDVGDTGDFTHGNRVDLGFMTEEDHGWMISWINVNNPNEQVTNTNLSNGFIAGIPSDVSGIPDILDGIFVDLGGAPLGDFNTSINSGRFWSFELNKLFRQEPLHNNVVIEPLVGVRYMNFKDYFYAKDAEFDLVGVIDADGNITSLQVVEIDKFHGAATNEILTGQLGFRTYGQRGRWVLSGELRVFAGHNFQAFERTHVDELQIGGDGGAIISDSPDHGVVVRRDEFELSEFALGTEIRANASYYISRDVSLNLGLEIVHIGEGIARGFDLQNNERLTMIGATFGLVLNR